MVTTFEKLGKEVKDLFEEHYNIGQVKIGVKNSVSNALGFDFSGNCNAAEEGKVTSGLETKYDLSSYGLKTNIKWTTDNELITEFFVVDAPSIIDGLQLSFIARNNMAGGGGDSKGDAKGSDAKGGDAKGDGPKAGKSGMVKASLETSNFNVVGNLEFEGDSPKINSSGVFKYNDYLVGFHGLIDAKAHKVSNQTMAIGWHQGPMQLVANYNFKDVNIGVFKQGLIRQQGIRLSFAEGKSKLSFAMQQSMDLSSTLKAKLNSEGQVGLAYIYQYKPGVKISISSLVEAKNLFTGGHKIGLGINFEG